MLSIFGRQSSGPRGFCDGVSRRDFLTIGGMALGGVNLAGVEIINAQIRQRLTREPGTPKSDAQNLALARFCQAIFALNEFIYVD